MAIRFISLVLQLSLLTLPTKSQTDNNLPQYDFWDDPSFDDRTKSNFSQGRKRDVLKDQSVDECVNACLNNDTCISIFYHARRKICERVPTNIVLNSIYDDKSIVDVKHYRYYRYIPPGTNFCKLENCFYYDRKAKACWKVLFRNGPRGNGRFSFMDAQRSCEAEGGQMASLDTLEKVQQVSLFLSNIPAIGWRLFHVGGRRETSDDPILWKNGKKVSEDLDASFNTNVYSPFSKRNNYNCLILSPFKQDDVIVEYRLSVYSCRNLHPGTVCEMIPPAEDGAN